MFEAIITDVTSHGTYFLLSMIVNNINTCNHSYNPIGDWIGGCPAIDRRNPLVIDMYNQITERTCNKYNVSFIDTNDIMSPLWDRASDYCHYNDISSDWEAIYIVDKIFE